ncbi:hypothetical protein EHS25_001257 [Saitozyma podzolica]|uniref:Rab-GAP TBC domain-containing protein n=1 Tax=Saitozyma podzolica TaxID=1890683 RepID=A0A427YHU7_9TREE|nr:hypothetical protein EHS25_001257 [Saitozyma podzolica]
MTARGPSEDAVFARPDAEDIRSAWTALFSDPILSLSRLRSSALSKLGLGETAADGGILLRSVYWRFYHGLLPTPTSLDLFPPALETSRAAYTSLRRRYLVAPDGRWAADCSGAEEQAETGPSSPKPDGDGWDPLSLDGQSPWKTWFAHQELRATIRQDVERTFPDIPYFELERVRTALVTVLFLFSVLNPDVGYRQGMHELLAVCFLTVDRDSLLPPRHGTAENPPLRAMYAALDRRYVEHDAFGLFQEVMRGAKAFYEWRAEEGPRIRSVTAPQAPIIIRCNHIHNSLLRRIDPQLWERLETEGVEAQIWAILIFTRELPFPLALRIWDGVFSEDPGLGILDFICVAMLLLIRNELLVADYPTLLTNLLHYPAPSPAYPFSPFLILSQAIFLRNNISPASGVEVVIQNQDILGVRAAPPEPEEQLGGRSAGRGGPSIRGRPPRAMPGFAQGLFERAQAAGLDKAILSTVADLRKNLPDSATAYSYLPNLPFSPLSPAREPSHFSTIPSTAAALPNRTFFPPSLRANSPRPTVAARASMDSDVSIKSLKDAEREIAELRLALLGMGKAMTEWLHTVEPADSTSDDPHVDAWRGLGRIRDTLLDAAGQEVDEIVREWAWHDGLEAPSSRATTPGPDTSAPASASAEATNSNVFERSLPVEPPSEVTPTAPAVTIMPSTPRIPVPVPITAHQPSKLKTCDPSFQAGRPTNGWAFSCADDSPCERELPEDINMEWVRCPSVSGPAQWKRSGVS